MLAQMCASHAAGVVIVGEASFDQFSTLAQETLPFGTLESLAVLVDGWLLPFLAHPMPLARLLLLGNVSADADGLHLFYYRTTVVSLVGHHFFDAVQVHLGRLRGCCLGFEHRPHGWPHARRFVVARRFIPEQEPQTILFTLGRYVHRAWVTNMDLTPPGIWHFYDGRAGMEPRICELREDFGLRKIPTASFAANALYLEIIRLAYNLVTAFQRNCLQESWQNRTLKKLRYKLFLLPGELTRPQNRLILQLRKPPKLQDLVHDILGKLRRLSLLQP